MAKTSSRAALAATALLCAVALGGVSPSGSVAQAGTRSARGEDAASSTDAVQRLLSDPAGPPVVEVPAGVHHGALFIKRPVVLRGAPGAILDGDGKGTVLTVEANDVFVEKLAVRHSGRRNTREDAGIRAKGERVHVRDVTVTDTLFGIVLNECHDCSVERAHVTGLDETIELRGDGIKLWESHGSSVRDSVVDQSRDLVVWYTRHATLEKNTVTRSRYGTHFMYAHDALLEKCRFERNVVGVFVMYSLRLKVLGNVMAGARGAAGVGIGFKDSDAIEVRDNWFVANTTGTYLDNTPRTLAEPVTLAGNVLALNDVGLRLHSAEAGLHLTGNDFRNNATVVEVDGGLDALKVDVRGNHFSDYAGYDLNGDGIGDVAYEVKTLSSDLAERHPSLKFFHGTAAMGVLDAMAHALPVFSAKRLLVDPAPLARPPHVERL